MKTEVQVSDDLGVCVLFDGTTGLSWRKGADRGLPVDRALTEVSLTFMLCVR